MHKFPKIKQIRNTVQYVDKKMRRGSTAPSIRFIGTVKTHGTNAGVRRLKSGQLNCQSRNEVKGSGHFGFVEFVKNRESEIHGIMDHVFGIGAEGTLFGEWIGPGIQKGVAVSELPGPVWLIFAARYRGGDWMEHRYFEANSGWIAARDVNIYNVYDFDVHDITIDFNNPSIAADEIAGIVFNIEKRCPVGEHFGIDGIGEGLVFTPADPSLMGDEEFWFKVKGDAHKKVGSAPKPPKVDLTPEKHTELDSLVHSLVTDERLDKGFAYLEEVGLARHANESIGKYLGYVLGDLKQEDEDTVKASGFTWKQFTRVATRKVRDEFFDAQMLALHTGER